MTKSKRQNNEPEADKKIGATSSSDVTNENHTKINWNAHKSFLSRFISKNLRHFSQVFPVLSFVH